MDIKRPILPSSQHNPYLFIIYDAFSHFVVTNLTQIASELGIQTVLFHWNTKFDPPQTSVTG